MNTPELPLFCPTAPDISWILNSTCSLKGPLKVSLVWMLEFIPRPSALTAPLYERGALRAMLTGSGSAVFGVFADAASASACAAALSAVYPFAAHVVFTEQEKDGL